MVDRGQLVLLAGQVGENLLFELFLLFLILNLLLVLGLLGPAFLVKECFDEGGVSISIVAPHYLDFLLPLFFLRRDIWLNRRGLWQCAHFFPKLFFHLLPTSVLLRLFKDDFLELFLPLLGFLYLLFHFLLFLQLFVFQCLKPVQVFLLKILYFGVISVGVEIGIFMIGCCVIHYLDVSQRRSFIGRHSRLLNRRALGLEYLAGLADVLGTYHLLVSELQMVTCIDTWLC